MKSLFNKAEIRQLIQANIDKLKIYLEKDVNNIQDLNVFLDIIKD